MIKKINHKLHQLRKNKKKEILFHSLIKQTSKKDILSDLKVKMKAIIERNDDAFYDLKTDLWSVSTKYYTALIQFINQLSNDSQAVVYVIDDSINVQEFQLEISQNTTLADKKVVLCLGININNENKIEKFIDFLYDYQIEYISYDINDDKVLIEHENTKEKYGLERVIEALECNIWEYHQLHKSQMNSIATTIENNVIEKKKK